LFWLAYWPEKIKDTVESHAVCWIETDPLSAIRFSDSSGIIDDKECNGCSTAQRHVRGRGGHSGKRPFSFFEWDNECHQRNGKWRSRASQRLGGDESVSKRLVQFSARRIW